MTGRLVPRLGGVALAAALASALPLGAQGASCTRLDALPAVPAQGWAAPLDRPVSLVARDVALRDVLDRIAATAVVRLSYSPDLLPLERRVCVDFRAVALGGALSELLAGTGVEARVVSTEQVALAPLPGGSAPATASRTAVLEQVVVTGSAAGAPERPLSIGLTVLGGAELRQRGGSGSTAGIFDGAVPGVWLWEQPPTTLLAQYASIRGASSFGISYPKVYIDGIEMASPLLLSRLDPEMIERVEVIRGPQGAALYGTDAISGVVNIVTRTAGSAVGTPRLSGHASFGVAGSDYVARPPVTQEYGGSFRAGSSVRAFTLGVTAGGTGAWIPGAWDRHLGATASTRVVGTKTIVTGTARLQLADALATVSPLLVPLFDTPPPADRQTANQYTLGTNIRVMQSERVTHTLVLGVDGYRLHAVGLESTPIPSAADSALRAANGAADRATLRVGSVIGFGSDLLATTLTVGAEESVLRSATDVANFRPPFDSLSGRRSGPGAPAFRRLSASSGRDGGPDHDSWNSAAWRSNTGLIAQGTTALAGRVYLTGGLRLEQNAGFLGAPSWNLLPMAGLSLVGGNERVMVKVRGAYGKGIRPARTASREISAGHEGNADIERLNLPPESQAGVEAGADLYVGRALALRLTLFDQTASNLIQPVVQGYSGGGGEYGPRIYYELQDVGRIVNRGVELEGSFAHGPASLSGSLATVSSTVLAIARGYKGDLMVGDRVLEVPQLTLGVTAAWNAERWSATLGLARAADWIGYDRLALTAAVLRDPTNLDTARVGNFLRDNWVRYSGVTHLRASVSRELGRGYSVLLAGENLLDVQTGEPDNITVLPGRTVRVGVRRSF